MKKFLMALVAVVGLSSAPAVLAQNVHEPVVTSETSSDDNTGTCASFGLLWGYQHSLNTDFFKHQQLLLAGEFKLADHVRFAPEVGATFEDNFNIVDIGLNIQEVWNLNKVFNFNGPRINAYGITGLNIENWIVKGYSDDNTFSLGANLAVGAEMLVGKHLKLSVQYRISPMSKQLGHTGVIVGLQYYL